MVQTKKNNGHSKKSRDVTVRAAQMVILRREGMKYQQIADIMGYHHYTTIMYHVKKHDVWYEYDARYREIFDKVTKQISTNPPLD